MSAIRSANFFVIHAQLIEARIESFNIFLPRDGPPWIVRLQEKLRGSVVIVCPKKSAAAANRVYCATGEFKNAVASLVPSLIPAVGIPLFDVMIVSRTSDVSAPP